MVTIGGSTSPWTASVTARTTILRACTITSCRDTDMDTLTGGEVADEYSTVLNRLGVGANCIIHVIEDSQHMKEIPEEGELKPFFLLSKLTHTEKLFRKSCGNGRPWWWWVMAVLVILGSMTSGIDRNRSSHSNLVTGPE